MMFKAFGRATLGGAVLLAISAGLTTGAGAQTAADLNRANQALQICASPMGAGIPECAKLKQQFGVGSAPAAPAAGGAAGILGALAGARGGNAAGVAGVLGALAGNAAAARAAPVAAPVGSNDYYVQSANATHAAAGNYQSCVAANPTNWQPCMAYLNGGVPVAPAPAAAAPSVNLAGAALAGYQRCLQVNPADKCAAAYGATAAPAGAPAAANGANAITSAANAAQTAKQLAPTIKALGSLLGR